MYSTVLFNKNDAGPLVHLFLDRMKKSKLPYLRLVTLYKSSHSSFKVLPPDGATSAKSRRLEGARSSPLCYKKGTICTEVVPEVHVVIGAQLGSAKKI